MLLFWLIACRPPPPVYIVGSTAPPPNEDLPVVPPPQPQTGAPRGFSWVVPGVLAAMAYPRDLDAVGAEGVDTLVSLTETPPSDEDLAAAGLLSVHLPIPDFTAPTLAQMSAFVATVEQAEQTGARVGVHCAAGLGRSGTMSAAWFVANGQSAEEALASIRTLRPGSVETLAQEQALTAFEELLRP